MRDNKQRTSQIDLYTRHIPETALILNPIALESGSLESHFHGQLLLAH
jgi:hypothetical protein